MKRLCITLTLIAAAITTCRPQTDEATVRPSATLSFKHIVGGMPEEWYASDEACSAADSVVKYQFPSGGWAKNNNWHQTAEGGRLKARQEVWRQIHSDSGIGATIDNGATITEMKLLAKVYKGLYKSGAKSKDTKQRMKTYRAAFIKGLDYLLEAQYDNGGWPQYYPHKPLDNEGHPFYSDHITFNDNAIYNVMQLLRDVYDDRKYFYRVLQIPQETKARLKEAFDRGIECILNCQVKKNGKLTVWCQQHDEHTLAPAPARAYELTSLTGSHETPALIELLMSVDKPDERIVKAVTAAVEWLKAHTIRDMHVEYFVNADGKRDRRLVHRFGANTWARYYDYETEEPYVCDRDGKPQPSLEYIGYERRNGYGWYGNTPQEVIDAYPQWLGKTKQP